ncbi:hypothetical protein Slin15195_G023960 [Septoria linicola]|uniref:Uncharacterized protein n=1 Tax=Septoria linicola TaxID=215465 RepID=A0A9Q9AN63_9PEZI|nr:hypothetical protein Slin15195_G023960 [Septoria linicola]
MIRFKSAGVTATLTTADLNDSLSRSVTLTMGKEQGVDDRRVDGVLSAGEPLQSIPIGADGTERGVLQYIGEHDDMAFLMVEAGAKEDAPQQQQALRLTIDTTEQAHVGPRKTTDMDIKIEVYLNGELCDSTLLNPRKTGLLNQYKLDGSRIQRQLEKPFTYQPSSELDPTSTLTAEQRWGRVSAAMAVEARLRGTDHNGNPPLAGRFCSALAQVPLPSRLQQNTCLGIIDILVLSGKGVKDGPSQGYIARPTRMRSEGYHSTEPRGLLIQLNPPVMGQLADFAKRRESHETKEMLSARRDSVIAAVPQQHPGQRGASRNSDLGGSIDTDAFASTIAEGEDPFADSTAPCNVPSSSSSSDTPLAAVSRDKPKQPLTLKLRSKTSQPAQSSQITPNAQSTPPNQAMRKLTQGEKNASEFAKAYGIPYHPQMKVENFRDRRGKDCGSRMVTQRIADINKMTPNNRDAAARALKNEIIRQQSSSNQVTPAKPPRGLVKLSLPSKASPAQTPTVTPREGTLGGPFQTPAQSTPNVTPLTRRASHKPGKLDDQTPEEALANFKLPDMCHGSVVSYAGGDASRQISKTRPGHFEEEEFIVGMRFVVV